MTLQDFNKALTDAESLVQAYPCLERHEKEGIYGIIHNNWITLAGFKNLVHLSDMPQYVNRLAALRQLVRQSRLDAAIEEREGLESREILDETIQYMVSELSSSSDRVATGEPTISTTDPVAWSMPIIYCRSDSGSYFHYSYSVSLLLRYSARPKHFSVCANNEELRTSSTMRHAPIVFAPMADDRRHLRIILVDDNFCLTDEYYEIKMRNAEDHKILMQHLLQLGCTIYQRPASTTGNMIGPEDSLRNALPRNIL